MSKQQKSTLIYFKPISIDFYSYDWSIDNYRNVVHLPMVTLKNVVYFNIVKQGESEEDIFKFYNETDINTINTLNSDKKYKLVTGFTSTKATVDFLRVDTSGNFIDYTNNSDEQGISPLQLENIDTNIDSFSITNFGYETHHKLFEIINNNIILSNGIGKRVEQPLRAQELLNALNLEASITKEELEHIKKAHIITFPKMDGFRVKMSSIYDNNERRNTRINLRRLSTYKSSFSNKILILYLEDILGVVKPNIDVTIRHIPCNYTMSFDRKLLYVNLPLSFDLLTLEFNFYNFVTNAQENTLHAIVIDDETRLSKYYVESLQFTFSKDVSKILIYHKI